MSISERIKQIVDFEGGLPKFSEKTGLNYKALYSTLQKNGKVRSDTLESIAITYPKLNLKWLLTGKGPMWLEGMKQSDVFNNGVGEAGKSSNESEELLREMVELQRARLRQYEKEMKKHLPELAKELGIK